MPRVKNNARLVLMLVISLALMALACNLPTSSGAPAPTSPAVQPTSVPAVPPVSEASNGDPSIFPPPANPPPPDALALGALWNQLKAANVGDGLFPDYSWRELVAGPTGALTWGDQIHDNHVVSGDKIVFRPVTGGFERGVYIYVGAPGGPEPPKLSGPFDETVILNTQNIPGRATYGLALLGKRGERWKWVGFDWITLIKSHAGTWYSPGRCDEQDEFPYRWSVSLLEHSDENLEGTIHFHKCPNGGQAIYGVVIRV